MGVQEIIAESKKKMEMEILKKRNEELDRLLEKLTEAEEKIRQEELKNYVMPEDVNNELQEKAIKDYNQEQKEQEKQDIPIETVIKKESEKENKNKNKKQEKEKYKGKHFKEPKHLYNTPRKKKRKMKKERSK